jgi:hypothetical protein
LDLILVQKHYNTWGLGLLMLFPKILKRENNFKRLRKAYSNNAWQKKCGIIWKIAHVKDSRLNTAYSLMYWSPETQRVSKRPRIWLILNIVTFLFHTLSSHTILKLENKNQTCSISKSIKFRIQKSLKIEQEMKILMKFLDSGSKGLN